MDTPAALQVLQLLQASPSGLGGVHLRAPADAARSAWLDALHAGLAADLPWVRVPANVTPDTLLGGIDLPATLAAGRPVARQGLLARAHGGVLLLPLAERAAPLVLACIQQALDDQEVQLARDGLLTRYPAAFTLILLEDHEDAQGAESLLPAGLLDRIAFTLDAAQLQAWWRAGASASAGVHPGDADASAASRDRAACDAALAALCLSAAQFGIASLRAPLLAWNAACTLARLAGRATPHAQDLEMAASLVYAVRARQLPQSSEEAAAEATAPAEPPQNAASPEQTKDMPTDASAEPQPPVDAAPQPPSAAQDGAAEKEAAESSAAPAAQAPPQPPATAAPAAQQPLPVDSAAAAASMTAVVARALPARLLERLQLAGPGAGSGRVSALAPRRVKTVRHGRPVGSEPGDPRQGRTLDLLATLRAALPWQKLRARPGLDGPRFAVRASDLRVRALKPRTRSTAVFAVDASGSAAMQRLGEAKGAIETLLAQCYVRRDQVALVSFRGNAAATLLPPTRSLARVRRELSALPGGGGTPLAQGIELANQLAGEVRRRGDAPLLVLLTDGRANVSLAGIGGRAQAEQDALSAARAVRQSRLPCLLIDIARQPQPRAAVLAQALGAEYLLLPGGGSQALSAAVQARMASAGAGACG